MPGRAGRWRDAAVNRAGFNPVAAAKIHANQVAFNAPKADSRKLIVL